MPDTSHYWILKFPKLKQLHIDTIKQLISYVANNQVLDPENKNNRIHLKDVDPSFYTTTFTVFSFNKELKELEKLINQFLRLKPNISPLEVE